MQMTKTESINNSSEEDKPGLRTAADKRACDLTQKKWVLQDHIWGITNARNTLAEEDQRSY